MTIVREMIKTVIENHINDEWCTIENVLKNNAQFFINAKKHNVNIVFIDDNYEVHIDL